MSSWFTNCGSSKNPGVSAAHLYVCVVRRYARPNTALWSHALASGSKRRRISRMALSTQLIFPATHSSALVGSYSVVRDGSTDVHSTKVGSSACATVVPPMITRLPRRTVVVMAAIARFIIVLDRLPDGP
jgi:hypothetical protein